MTSSCPPTPRAASLGAVATLLLVGLLGCSKATSGGPTSSAAPAWTAGPAAPTEPHAEPTATSPAAPPRDSGAAPAAAAHALLGIWASSSCGERSYERTLELLEAGRFRASDRVSPCPPGAQCVWSGIVGREGTWSVRGSDVALTIDKDGKGPKLAALPQALLIEGASLLEVAGAERCGYVRR